MADAGVIGTYRGMYPGPSANNAAIVHTLPLAASPGSNKGPENFPSVSLGDFRTARSIQGFDRPGKMLTYNTTTYVYSVAGNVREDNVARPGYIVRMFRRDNGALLAETKTDSLGNFTLTTVAYSGLVSVVAYDELGITSLNALIYDQVTPV